TSCARWLAGLITDRDHRRTLDEGESAKDAHTRAFEVHALRFGLPLAPEKAVHGVVQLLEQAPLDVVVAASAFAHDLRDDALRHMLAPRLVEAARALGGAVDPRLRFWRGERSARGDRAGAIFAAWSQLH